MKFSMLSEFLRLLRESQKLFFRNGKAMSSITLLIVLVSSTFLAIAVLFLRRAVEIAIAANLLAVTGPASDEYPKLLTAFQHDIRLLLGEEWIFFLGVAFTSILFATASILAAAVSYCGKDLSVKQLLPKALKSLRRPLVTWFYITLLDLGYFAFLFAFVLPLVLIFNLQLRFSAFAIIVGIVAQVFESYLAVVWKLAFVVSVLEEKSGIEALGKAAQLIKGSKMRAWFLNIVIVSSTWGLYGLVRIGTKDLRLGKEKIIPWVLFNGIICLIVMVSQMAYTVLYYECKETHGEELEMQGSLEYTKVTSAMPLIVADAV